MQNDRALVTETIKCLNLFEGDVGSAVRKIGDWIEDGGQSGLLKVFTPNAEQIIQASESKAFLEQMKQADMLLPDGMGLVWAYGRLRGKRLKRVSGVDVMRDLCLWAVTHNKKVFLLGGRNDVGKRVKKRILSDCGAKSNEKCNDRLIEYDGGPKEYDDETLGERVELMRRIEEFRPDVIFVAFGAPKQERWVIENEAALEKMGVKVAMVVGGAMDMLSGDLRRAPVWMRHAGLEWLWRLAQEPWRWRRQLRLWRFVRGVMWG